MECWDWTARRQRAVCRPGAVGEWLEQRCAAEGACRAAEPAAPRWHGDEESSYLEQREYEQIEQRIAEAEARLAEAQARLEAPETVRDPARLEACWQEVRAAQEEVDRLYARWAELEEKLS